KGSLYFLDLNTKTFNQIMQFPIPINNLTINWSADDSSILITADNSSTNQTEIYFLNAEELQKKSPAAPTLLWSGGNINPILQPVPYHGAIAELPKPAAPALKPTPVTTPLWSDANNGDLIAFTSDRPGSSGIYITKSDGSQTTYLANLSGGIPVWSPDGNYIAFSQFQNNKNPSMPGKNALYVAHPDGSNISKLADETWIFSWSPDSQKMAYLISEPQKINSAYGPVKMTIQIVKLDGAVLQTIDVGTYSALDQLRWSPDGQTLYYTVSQLVENDGTAKESSIYQIAINGKTPVLVVKSDKRIDEWTGTRSDLTYLVRDIRGWNLLHTDGKNETAVATWTENSCASNNFGWSAETTAKQWSPDGKYLLILFSCSNSSDTWLYVGSKDGKFTQLLNYSIQNASYSSSDPYNPNAWSSDSQYIVFASDLEAPGNRDIYVLNVQAALKDPAIQPVRLTTSGFGESYPAWQPKP
ncbi:MAG: hypothetical protein ABI986_12220, partial [Chloroflexota bacterium]